MQYLTRYLALLSVSFLTSGCSVGYSVPDFTYPKTSADAFTTWPQLDPTQQLIEDSAVDNTGDLKTVDTLQARARYLRSRVNWLKKPIVDQPSRQRLLRLLKNPPDPKDI
jgi:hypothetical protein